MKKVMGGRGKQVIVAMRGRNIIDGKRKDFNGAPTIQRLEMNMNDESNCLTGVQKDNLVIEPFITNPKMRNFEPNYSACPAITSTSYKEPPVVGNIRRLTEIECERLQGYKDNHTEYGLYPIKKVSQAQMNKMSNDELISLFETGVLMKKKVPRTQRYKLCGNAVTVDVVGIVGVKLKKSKS